jgi:glycosyltransferase involved in cell wall biosynthesis
MKLSVIIPTYNEEGVIGDCLRSLLKQSFEYLEIIIVDDGSTDKTKGVIVSLITNHKSPITMLQQQHQGPGAARNLGAKHAKGKILVFVDADMTFDKDFLKELAGPVIKGKTKGTFSKNEYVANWDNVWARCWNINEGWEEKKRHPKDYPDEQKVFRAILKSEFDKVGGFTPGGYTDDYSLSDKLGYKARAVKGAHFYHKNPDNLKEVYLQARWASKRKYKLGFLGYIAVLVRSGFLVSLFAGLIKAVKQREAEFVVFKLVYDQGIFTGILQLLLTGKKVK